MRASTTCATSTADRWSQSNGTPANTGLLVPALVLLVIVIAVELMSLVLVIQGHVVEAGIRERIRAANPVTMTVAIRR